MNKPNSGNSGHSRDQVVAVASQDGVHRLRRIRRRTTAVSVIVCALALEAGLARHAPGWYFIAPVTGIVSGFVSLVAQRRRP